VKSDGDHDGRSEGCRRSESGRAFHEGPEKPSDENRLDPSVRGDAEKGMAYGIQRSAAGEDLEQEDGAKDNPENGKGGEKPFDHGGGEVNRWNLPELPCRDGRQGQADGHGPHCRETEQNQEDKNRQNRHQCGEECQECHVV